MKIYIVTYGAVHVNITIAMARAYQKAGDEFVILAMPAAIKALENNNIPFLTLRDYAGLFPEWDAINTIGQNLARQYHNHESGISFDVTSDYYGVSMHCLINELGAEEAWKRFQMEGRKAFMPVEAMKRILQHEKPDVLQVTCDVRMELAAVMAAKELGIVSFNILDAPHVLKKPVADYHLLINEDVKSKYIEASIEPHRLVVTGQPVFESYHRFCAHREKPKVLADLHLTEEQEPLVTYISRPACSDITDVVRHIINIAKQKPWNFVIKLHPTGQNISDFDTLACDIPSNLRIVKDYYTAGLLAASDVVLVHDSVCGLEALLMKKPLVVIDLPSISLSLDYYSKGAAVFVKDVCDLEEAITNALYDDSTKNALLKACEQYESSSNATQNIIAFVHGLSGQMHKS